MSEQVALKFETDDGIIYCLELLLNERGDLSFSLPGDMSLIIPKKALEWFKHKLDANGQKYVEVRVVSAADVPELAAELRARYWRGEDISSEFRDPEWKKTRIKELRKKLFGKEE